MKKARTPSRPYAGRKSVQYLGNDVPTELELRRIHDEDGEFYVKEAHEDAYGYNLVRSMKGYEEWTSANGLVTKIKFMKVFHAACCMRLIWHVAVNQGLLGNDLLETLRDRKYFALDKHLKINGKSYREAINRE